MHGGHWMGVHGGHWMSEHRALDGSWMYMWPTSWTMVPVKPQQTLFPIPQALAPLRPHCWKTGHIICTICRMLSLGRTARAVSCHNSLGWVHPWPRCRRVSLCMHPECNLAKIHRYQCIDKYYTEYGVAGDSAKNNNILKSEGSQFLVEYAAP